MPSEVSIAGAGHERDTTVEELKRGLTDAQEQQAATAEILKVISSSPTDLKRVFAVVARNAARLCDANDAAIFQVDGGNLCLVAHHGPIAVPGTFPLVRGLVIGRAVLDRRTIHIDDAQTKGEEYPEGADTALRLGFRTNLAVPLICKGAAIGVINIRRNEARPFSDRHVDLLETFADQAVIAIENTRLFEAEQASKRELQESLEYQTATSDVLGVISRTPTDLQPVLAAICATAARLCETKDVEIFIRHGDRLRLGWVEGPIGTEAEDWPISRGLVMGRAVLNGELIQVHDLRAAGDEYPEGYQSSLLVGHRTIIAVQLMRKGEAVGVLTLRRPEVKPFTDKQIALLRTFADQAVIAIENTRLFEEVQARTRELAKTVEDLEIASQHKNQFVANMSHELRTPLAAILGYAELIQEGFYGAQLEKSLDALTRIRSNGKHLLGLINTVLDIAKIESGQFTLNMTEYAIESVVETVRAATESLAQNK